MKGKKVSKRFVTILAVIMIVVTASFAVFASVIYDSGGSTVSTGSTSGKGNTVPSAFANTSSYPISGIRVSIVNANTGATKGANRNVFVDSTYLHRNMFSETLNKVQMINSDRWAGGFHLVSADYFGYQAADFGMGRLSGYTSATISEWERDENNLRYIASLVLAGNSSRAGESLNSLLEPGDRILIECLYPLKINNVQYYLTCSEYASIGATICGNVNVGPGNSGNTGTISFIGQTLAYYWPTGMYAPQGSISSIGVGAASSLGGQTTWAGLLTQAYGMHIAYTDDRPSTCTLTVKHCVNMVSNDGKSRSGYLWVDTNSYTINAQSTIRIADYANNYQNYTFVRSDGYNYSNPWNYNHYGSFAEGWTNLTTDTNATYYCGGDITIDIYYEPADAQQTLNCNEFGKLSEKYYDGVIVNEDSEEFKTIMQARQTQSYENEEDFEDCFFLEESIKVNSNNLYIINLLDFEENNLFWPGEVDFVIKNHKTIFQYFYNLLNSNTHNYNELFEDIMTMITNGKLNKI